MKANQLLRPLLRLVFLAPIGLVAQTNIHLTDPNAEQILLGKYDPAQYLASSQIVDPLMIASGIAAEVSPEILKQYIIRLSEFGNRNTGSDTVSATRGIGAARRWVFQKFQEISAANEGRLQPCYLQFDQTICSVGQHRNILAILPGTDTARAGSILIEGHIDSRCEGLCDTACLAEGVEDNASGTALVIELARVMSKYTFKNTIVFMVVIGEEQGLYGAAAMAQFCKTKQIPLRAVLNNDVIGGVICGKTASPPGCSGLNTIDSTSLRLFSSGSFNSKHKQLARFLKLEYAENLKPLAAVPMNVRIMSPEDRTGRGGDHIPFREQLFTAMRFTAANEHGDASNGTGYTDRQHSKRDVLGVDTDGDGAVDSFFVQFNYLARNAVINGNGAAMAALNVPTPTDFTAMRMGNVLTVSAIDSIGSPSYRVALRTTTNDWDTVYLVPANPNLTWNFTLTSTPALIASVAGVDGNGVESLFSGEKIVSIINATNEPSAEAAPAIELYQNRPNPFDEATWISFWVNTMPAHREAAVQIVDFQGKTIAHLPVNLKLGMNEVLYTHGYGVFGTFAYSLVLDGRVVATRQMVFAN